MPPTDCALLVFAKLPQPGAVKTRLTAMLNEEEAARLYEAFLLDALDQYRTLDVAVRLYLAPEAEGAVPEALHKGSDAVRWQQGDGLGARMQHAFLDGFAAGYERLVVVGTDHPTLPTAFFEAAFDALTEPLSISLGPSDDGGYYLLGLNDYFPSLFQGMTYSHADVFEQTLERATATGAGVTVLPTWYDVDTPDALRRLAHDLAEQPAGAERTREVVRRLGTQYPSLLSAGNQEARKSEMENGK